MLVEDGRKGALLPGAARGLPDGRAHPAAPHLSRASRLPAPGAGPEWRCHPAGQRVAGPRSQPGRDVTAVPGPHRPREGNGPVYGRLRPGGAPSPGTPPTAPAVSCASLAAHQRQVPGVLTAGSRRARLQRWPRITACYLERVPHADKTCPEPPMLAGAPTPASAQFTYTVRPESQASGLGSCWAESTSCLSQTETRGLASENLEDPMATGRRSTSKNERLQCGGCSVAAAPLNAASGF